MPTAVSQRTCCKLATSNGLSRAEPSMSATRQSVTGIRASETLRVIYSILLAVGGKWAYGNLLAILWGGMFEPTVEEHLCPTIAASVVAGNTRVLQLCIPPLGVVDIGSPYYRLVGVAIACHKSKIELDEPKDWSNW
ncbi:uncharacterized protein ARMOST_02273 [Armillaria ostoyae]|uniref:Uncharacterized protein n=1 Tax=Armillaria ostoyae TaxID=47428 RepID=A0A284QR99_ARMOS|nr:uncharacterized protein ARMOST_02273 [Armillaria ostoyae]